MQPAPPLPDGQAELATLLVDLPHLASLAERSGALDRVTDPRLSPIVRAVIEGAKGGKNLSMPELLELVDVPSQQLVHDVVFSGRYRNLDGTAELTANPGAEMHALLRRCDENEINARIRDIDERTREAQRSGDTDAVRELQQQRLELRRRQSELREDQRLGESSTEPAPN